MRGPKGKAKKEEEKVKEKKEGKKEKASKNEEKKKEAEGEEKESPIKVNLYDSNAIRQTLDDCVLKILEDEGYAESTFLSNVKLILGFITCAIALYSHFGPTPYPQNKPSCWSAASVISC